MAIFVLRAEDKHEEKATRRVYLWKGLESAGMLCRHTKFFRTRSEAEKTLTKVSAIWPNMLFTIQPAFAD